MNDWQKVFALICRDIGCFNTSSLCFSSASFFVIWPLVSGRSTAACTFVVFPVAIIFAAAAFCSAPLLCCFIRAALAAARSTSHPAFALLFQSSRLTRYCCSSSSLLLYLFLPYLRSFHISISFSFCIRASPSPPTASCC